ncbi:MAG: C10 family peptidase [Bacteroidales bacterium]|nr:C10 family peptidase [Bacteroidales bacterium]
MKPYNYINILVTLALVTIFYSCNKQADIATPQISLQSYTIPLDEAIESLNLYLQSETKSKANDGCRIIESVHTINAESLKTKSGKPLIDTPDCHELLYLVNFADGRGSAILSADSRIKGDVIAVTDSGTIDENSFYPRPSTRYIDPVTEIDTLGYNNEYGDWYVGDYIEQGQNMQESNFVVDLCLEYAASQVRGGIHPPIGEIGGEDPFTPIYDVVTQISTSISDPYHSNNLLYQMVGWSQSISPFNNLVHTIWSKDRVGCVNIALGKILAYNEYPINLSYFSYPINWYSIKTDVNYTGADSVAALLALLFHSTGSAPLPFGTFNLPILGAAVLTLYGYQNVSYTDYNESAIINRLNNDCPVFISSVPTADGITYNVLHSHAWNIDNYRYKTTTTVSYFYLNDVLDHTTTATTTYTMFHCAWGWGSKCDGYFISNVFDLQANSCIFDDGVSHDETDTEYYNHYLKIITYDKPSI